MKSLYSFLSKNGGMVALGLGVFLILVYLITVITGLSGAGFDMSTDLVDVLKDKESKETFDFFNFGLYVVAALMFLAAVAVIVFGIMQLVEAPKNSIKFLAGIGVVAVLYLIFSNVGGGEVGAALEKTLDAKSITDSVSSFISGGINTGLTLLMAGVAALILMEVRNLAK